jgi:hypothetical protein
MVGGSEAKKRVGSKTFFDILFMVFSNSPRRETPKNQKRGKNKKTMVQGVQCR